MRIEIVGWGDYNPRHDLKHVPWVRIESDIATSRKLFGLTGEQKWFWIYLIALAGSQNKNGFIDAELSYLSHFSGVPETAAAKALEHFQSKNLIKVVQIPNGSDRNPNGSVLVPNDSVPNGTGRDGTNVTNENSPNGESGDLRSPRAPYQDFVSLWNTHRGTLAGIEGLSDSRKGKVRARWKEKPDLAYWEGCVKRLAASSFACSGKWATFDWLLKNDTNHVKVAEGKYDDQGAGESGGKTALEVWNEEMDAKERAAKGAGA